MEFKLLEEKENPLFSRKEVVFDVNAKVTPSNDEVQKLITEKFSTESGNVKIKKIHGKFGSNDFKVSAFIYKSEDDKNKIEPKSKKGIEKKVEETPAPVVEKPKEEVKEEKQDAEESN
jgi:ribosomal protein S24E